MSEKRSLFVGFVLVIAFSLFGCIPSIGGSSFSQDEVKAHLISGVTTQDEVKKIYGEPTNIAKEKSGEIWTYTKESSGMNKFFANTTRKAGMVAVAQTGTKVGAAAAEKGGVVGGAVASSTALDLGSEATESVAQNIESQSKTLIIYFDKRKIVKNFSLN